MGLDMYLNAKRYMSRYSDKKTNLLIRKLFPEIGESGNLESTEISFEIGYWRKANQIHHWFVLNVQAGEDDCGDYEVSREQLEELRKLCNEVISKSVMMKDKVTNGYMLTENGEEPILEDGKIIINSDEIAGILPTAEGFFFGSTDYDEYYLDDIENTIRIIDKCLNLPDIYTFEYHSSW